MLETARRSFTSDWLTVDEIAAELKISKSIVYRLIRNGELEAVDLVDNRGKIARKGHYRIMRSSLNQFLESKKVRPFAKGEESSWIMSFRVLLIARSVCSETSWT